MKQPAVRITKEMNVPETTYWFSTKMESARPGDETMEKAPKGHQLIIVAGRDQDQLKATRINLVKRFGDRFISCDPEIEHGFYTDTHGNYGFTIIVKEEKP